LHVRVAFDNENERPQAGRFAPIHSRGYLQARDPVAHNAQIDLFVLARGQRGRTFSATLASIK